MDRRLAASDLSSLLRSPDALLAHPACEIIKDQRKVKIGRVALSVDNRQKTIYVKRYNAFSWRYKLGSLFMRSASMAALEGAQTLAHAEIDALRPLGAVEWRRCGVLHGSAFFSEEIKGGHTADDYWRKQLAPIPGPEGYRRRRAFLNGLASLLKQLHQKSIYHNDLKDANIMVRNDCGGVDKLFLLDLEGVRRCWYVSRRRRIKNLVQLNRTLGNFLSQADKLFFLKIYLGSVRGGARTRRPWARRVLRATRSADLRSRLEKTAPRPT
jgi:serine/threonine protein kinase